MRKYRKWVVALGLITAAPNVGLGGPFGLFESEPATPAQVTSNQQIAEQVKNRLLSAKLKGATVEITFVNGLLTLQGKAPDTATMKTIERLAYTVDGVRRVQNKMTLSAKATPPAAQRKVAAQQKTVRSAAYKAPAHRRQQVRQVQQTSPMPPTAASNNAVPPAPPVAPPAAPPATPPAASAAAAAVSPATPPPAVPPRARPPYRPRRSMVPPQAVPPAPPAWAHAGAAATGAVYDQPALPKYAWPSYSAYPNYAAVTYPKQYSASAWPYIGPFYPYPQVPLGWRKVTLEWDDGHWFLDFDSRTDQWWWFMNPKNW